jgi:hypothetical protein
VRSSFINLDIFGSKLAVNFHSMHQDNLHRQQVSVYDGLHYIIIGTWDMRSTLTHKKSDW